jgi:hypothetical protein
MSRSGILPALLVLTLSLCISSMLKPESERGTIAMAFPPHFVTETVRTPAQKAGVPASMAEATRPKNVATALRNGLGALALGQRMRFAGMQ